MADDYFLLILDDGKMFIVLWREDTFSDGLLSSYRWSQIRYCPLWMHHNCLHISSRGLNVVSWWSLSHDVSLPSVSWRQLSQYGWFVELRANDRVSTQHQPVTGDRTGIMWTRGCCLQRPVGEERAAARYQERGRKWNCFLLRSHCPLLPSLRLTPAKIKLRSANGKDCEEQISTGIYCIHTGEMLWAMGSGDESIHNWDETRSPPHRHKLWNIKISWWGTALR